MFITLPTHRAWLLILVFQLAWHSEYRACGQEASAEPAVPSREALAALLDAEPMTPESWLVWRGRMLSWMDAPSDHTDDLFEAGRKFVSGQTDEMGRLTGEMARDAFAWYMLGSARLYGRGGTLSQRAARAEAIFRQSLDRDPGFARAHRNLAYAILLRRSSLDMATYRQAKSHLKQARQLDPNLGIQWIEAQVAFIRRNYAEAIVRYREAMKEEPESDRIATGYVRALLGDRENVEPALSEIEKLCQRFPDSASLAFYHGLAASRADHFQEAMFQFDRARQLGLEPREYVGSSRLRRIERSAREEMQRAQSSSVGLLRFGWIEALRVGGVGVAAVLSGLALFWRRRIRRVSQAPDG